MSSEEIFAKIYGTPSGTDSEDIFAKVYGEEPPLESRTKRPGAGGKAFLRGAFKVAKEAAKLRPENVLMPRKTFPGEEVLNEKVMEQIGDPEAGFGEKVIERGTEILPYLLGGEGAFLGKLGRAGLAAAAGEGAKEAGLGPIGEFLLETVVLGAPGFRKKIIPTAAQEESLEMLRRRGLSEKEIAPLIPSESKSRALKHLAKSKGRGEKAVKKTQDAMGKVYDQLIAEGESTPILSTQRASSLQSDLEKTIKEFPASSRKLIADDIEQMFRKPIRGKDLIDIQFKINDNLFGKKVTRQNQVLNKLKDPLNKALKEIDPKLGKDFELIQKNYSHFKRGIQKNLGPKSYDKLLTYGKMATLLGGIIKMNPTVLKTYLATEASRRLLTEFLINPRLQNLSRQMLKAVNENSPRIVKKLSDSMEEELKNQGLNPEEFNLSSDEL